MRYVFGNFELDTQRYELRQAGALQPLEPQGFHVLAYLLEHHDRVVSKDELLEQLWPGQHVTEATLTQRLVAVRQALGDSGRQQQYIKTLHRRGYRFIAPLTRHGEAAAEPEPVHMPAHEAVVAPPPAARLIGRDAEQQQIQQRFALALQGTRQLVFITGEAGIGKTALVDAVVQTLEESAEVSIITWPLCPLQIRTA